MIHSALNSHSRSFFGFSALWAPPIPLTTVAVNTHLIVEYNLCSLVAPPVLPDAMDISTSTSSPINHTIGCNTDSVEMKQFASLLREADEIDKLEAQIKEEEDKISRDRKSLSLHRNRYEQLLKDNGVLTRDVRQSTTRLKELQEDKQVTIVNEPALECLYAIFSTFCWKKFWRPSRCWLLQVSRGSRNFHPAGTS